MSDKKSCLNCAEHGTGLSNYCGKQATVCNHLSHWLRNPDLWLDILPTEPGWYWYERGIEGGIFKITALDIENWERDDNWVKKFKWQGPITPK